MKYSYNFLLTHVHAGNMNVHFHYISSNKSNTENISKTIWKIMLRINFHLIFFLLTIEKKEKNGCNFCVAMAVDCTVTAYCY